MRLATPNKAVYKGTEDEIASTNLHNKCGAEQVEYSLPIVDGGETPDSR